MTHGLLGLARRAQAIAEPLRLADVLSDPMNTEGCARLAEEGAASEWAGLLRRALGVPAWALA